MNEAELKKHLDEAEKNPRLIAAAVSGLPEKVLRYKPAPDKWCILEILGPHRRCGDYLCPSPAPDAGRHLPTIAPMDQDAWARNLGYIDVPAPEFVAVYGLIRLHNLRLLRRLKPGDLEKGAFHPELNRQFTVAELVERIAKHGASHLDQIEKLKRS